MFVCYNSNETSMINLTFFGNSPIESLCTWKETGSVAQKDLSPNSFSHVTFTKTTINPQNGLNSAMSNYRNWTKSTHQKEEIFWRNPDKIKFLTRSFAEILRVNKFRSHDHIYKIIWFTGWIFLVTSWPKLWRQNLNFKIPLL